ncbi:MAG: hypothetical protein FJ088_16235, partial [Deltaproteobacteria bacterium]|nr:hypothetical protein [Deltaproteobacteria bacterium]
CKKTLAKAVECRRAQNEKNPAGQDISETFVSHDAQERERFVRGRVGKACGRIVKAPPCKMFFADPDKKKREDSNCHGGSESVRKDRPFKGNLWLLSAKDPRRR